MTKVSFLKKERKIHKEITNKIRMFERDILKAYEYGAIDLKESNYFIERLKVIMKTMW